jgi:hypothetical protein
MTSSTTILHSDPYYIHTSYTAVKAPAAFPPRYTQVVRVNNSVRVDLAWIILFIKYLFSPMSVSDVISNFLLL